MKIHKNFNSFIVISILIFLSSCTSNSVTDLTLNKTSLNLLPNQIDSVTATISIEGDLSKLPTTWTSSNESVAKVSESDYTLLAKDNSGKTFLKTAVIKTVSAGNATISVKVGDKTVSCNITVEIQNIKPNLTQGALWYYGDAYNSGSNNFNIFLASSGVDLSTLSGNGELLMLELNTSIDAKDNIPTGTYEMMAELTQELIQPKTLFPAYIDPDTNDQYGSWFYGATANPIVQGNALITKTNDVYTIEYSLTDYYKGTITGKYEGTLSYVDKTKAAAVKRNVKGIYSNEKFKMKFVR
jgi:hypothetical protein